VTRRRKLLTVSKKLELIEIAVHSVNDEITPHEALALIAAMFPPAKPSDTRINRARLAELLDMIAEEMGEGPRLLT
jgi:hypothetical protein